MTLVLCLVRLVAGFTAGPLQKYVTPSLYNLEIKEYVLNK